MISLEDYELLALATQNLPHLNTIWVIKNVFYGISLGRVHRLKVKLPTALPTGVIEPGSNTVLEFQPNMGVSALIAAANETVLANDIKKDLDLSLLSSKSSYVTVDKFLIQKYYLREACEFVGPEAELYVRRTKFNPLLICTPLRERSAILSYIREPGE